ncbi:hypothetical protein, partial [Streptomyces sp. BK79]|uniref:hypothetical protein n=1 Tax=Streptomyces sp. BK79 TaxID=3350097 RepID=UPI00376FFDF3
MVEEIARAEYWVEQVRREVRFADAVSCLHAEGVETFVEIGPDGVLSAMGQGVVPSGAFVASVRRDWDECLSVMTALAHVHVRGARVDWQAVFGRSEPSELELPTYAFQHQRYWMTEGDSRVGDVSAVGLEV